MFPIKFFKNKEKMKLGSSFLISNKNVISKKLYILFFVGKNEK